MKQICYRVGTAPCATGWVDTVNCTDPNIYSLAIGGVPVVGAIEVACGDCPEVVTLAGGGGAGGGTYTDPTPDLTNAELRAAPLDVVLASAVRTASLAEFTAAGTVAAGARSVGFSNDGNVTATVAGGPLRAGRTVSFIAPDGDTLAAIPYDATGTTLTVAAVR